MKWQTVGIPMLQQGYGKHNNRVGQKFCRKDDVVLKCANTLTMKMKF